MVADASPSGSRTSPSASARPVDSASDSDLEAEPDFESSPESNSTSDGQSKRAASRPAGRRRTGTLSAHRSRETAGVSSVLRVLLFAVLCVSLALATVLAGPAIVDELNDLGGIDERPAPSEEPPVAGDRDPDRIDPDDPGETTYETDVEEVSSETIEDFVHAEVNDRRADHDLEPLTWDGTIASVSRAHSADMAERDYFDHVNPDGERPLDRFSDVGDYCRSYGENIALNWLDAPVQEPDGGSATEYHTAEGIAEGLVDQWMNSTDHRQAILEENVDGSWERAGVGVYVADDGKVYATQNFCSEW